MALALVENMDVSAIVLIAAPKLPQKAPNFIRFLEPGN
ncbi:hypothetical protein GFS31_34240 [Leptolyngbya sp. BL0902]|nr:hypothetical protein GFS31_34240 [Leptolyngbya sp. BL0902]